jgi:RNA ligase-like protein
MIYDMQKLESPFVRELNEHNEYLVINKINPGFEWVFEDDLTMAIEKLHGTNVSVVCKGGMIWEIYNRTERILFFNKGKMHIVKGIMNSFERGYIDRLGDGQHFGELIGPKINGNPYKLTEHLWIPYESYCRDHLRYKSWGKYPKDFETISNWFKELMPLFSLMRSSKEMSQKERYAQFVEGVVFTHPSGKMAKLRKDMFPWFRGRRHKGGIKV